MFRIAFVALIVIWGILEIIDFRTIKNRKRWVVITLWLAASLTVTLAVTHTLFEPPSKANVLMLFLFTLIGTLSLYRWVIWDMGRVQKRTRYCYTLPILGSQLNSDQWLPTEGPVLLQLDQLQRIIEESDCMEQCEAVLAGRWCLRADTYSGSENEADSGIVVQLLEDPQGRLYNASFLGEIEKRFILREAYLCKTSEQYQSLLTELVRRLTANAELVA